MSVCVRMLYSVLSFDVCVQQCEFCFYYDRVKYLLGQHFSGLLGIVFALAGH